MKTKALLSFLLLMLMAVTVKSQDGTRYRVTAYKNGNPLVTSVSNTAEIFPEINFYIPNAFTPNGDGLNDLFLASVEGVSEFSMQIYNRWGELIYESSDVNAGWDGTFNGNPCQQEVYVYKLSARGNGKPVYRNGSITLKR